MDIVQYLVDNYQNIYSILLQDEEFRKKYNLNDITVRSIIDNVISNGLGDKFIKDFWDRITLIMKIKAELLPFLNRTVSFNTSDGKYILGKLLSMLGDCVVVEDNNGNWIVVDILKIRI